MSAARHYSQLHPEYGHTRLKQGLHHALYVCSICGKRNKNFELLVLHYKKFHELEKKVTENEVRIDPIWFKHNRILIENYEKITSFFIEKHKDRGLTRRTFNISDFQLDQALWLAGEGQLLTPTCREGIERLQNINALRAIIIKNKKGDEPMAEKENTTTKSLSATSQEILLAIVGCFNENARLTLELKESHEESTLALEENSKLSKDLNVAKATIKLLEARLDQRINLETATTTSKINFEHERQQIEERRT
jgi:hypothetical protein